MSTGVVRVLENIPILSKMTLEQSIVLAKRIKVVEYRPGQIIFHMGEMGQTFYVIEAGEVEDFNGIMLNLETLASARASFRTVPDCLPGD